MAQHTETHEDTSTSDPFWGTWHLDPAQSQYAYGSPPQSGSYRIEPEGNGLRFTMAWVDVGGASREFAYHAIPDGQDHPYENPAVAETVSLTRVNGTTLDSASKKDGQVIAFGRRVLSADGTTMRITQSGTTPDGTPFDNISVYLKQPE